jgi:hypothetical protein
VSDLAAGVNTITTVILVAGFGHAEIVGEREICIEIGKEVMPHIVVGRLSWFFFILQGNPGQGSFPHNLQ